MELFKIKNPFALTIFGASGDLAKIKIFPAIYALALQKRLPKEFKIIGFARSPLTEIQFRKQFEESVKKHAEPETFNKKILKEVLKNVHYFQGDYSKKESFEALQQEIKKLTKKKTVTQLAYFSVPPVVFRPIIKNLGETTKKSQDVRLIIEKPFGQDTKSAQELFIHVSNYFDEDQIYLLDHYLGKSAVQSILSLRHSNRLLNMAMKGPEVANIQITAHESVGVENRIGYFDQVGTIKDMFQSHLLQILALITMSIPISEDHKGLKREKNNILSALRFTPSKNNITLGQYEGYKKNKEVGNNSKTETYFEMKLLIDRESWYNTPIYIRTGKKLNKKHAYVVVELKKFAFQSKKEKPNRLIFELQPDEKVSIKLVNKNPGASSEYQEVTTSDSIACVGDYCLPEHGLLLLDVIRKNRLHFLSFQEIIASWKITDQILQYIKRNKITPKTYKDSGSTPNLPNFTWYEH